MKNATYALDGPWFTGAECSEELLRLLLELLDEGSGHRTSNSANGLPVIAREPWTEVRMTTRLA